MSEIIPFSRQSHKSGFTQHQFRQLDNLYCRAAAEKALSYRTVECDFDEGVASYTYYKAEGQTPYLQFVIRRVGPRAMMYELYMQDKGRVAKSGVFEKAYGKLKDEVEKLIVSS